MSIATEIETGVTDVIRRHLHVTEGNLGPQTRFVDDLGADSLALVDLTLALEEKFDIDISDAESERIQTVGDAIVSVDQCLKSRR